MDVAFVVMPFADVGRPAIGVSLLKAASIRAGFSATVQYCSLSLAEVMGHDLYQHVSNSFAPEILVGEWFFADDVFGSEIPHEDEYLEKILAPFASHQRMDELRAARRKRDAYLDEMTRRISDLRPRIVGFTTTFHQTCSSLAVARRLKELKDPPIIVFGGANCEGEMGLQMMRSFPWIDHVCCGESDISFVQLLDHLLRGGKGPASGVLKRGEATAVTASEAVYDMNALPIPDYDDYFEQLGRSSLHKEVDPHLVIESSRGCWWGAKHHCTFCGLNGDTMVFRSKSPERAYEEIVFLARKYGRWKIAAVDNILDMRYIETVFPRLAALEESVELFYEVKSNLRFDQLMQMHKGGVRQIQPGIESLSDEVLSLMEKGVTGLQNIQLLRWCDELGIECSWNLLGGFPGESAEEYSKMAELVPFLTHLSPPCSCAQLRLDRFSPYHSRADHFGFENVRAARAYFFVFPLGRREMARLAYFFDFDYRDARITYEYMLGVQQAVKQWWGGRVRAEERPRLDAEFDGEDIIVHDTRPVRTAAEFRLEGLKARVFALCDVATTLQGILRQSDLAGRRSEVTETLESLTADRLIFQDHGRYLALAVFRNRSWHPEPKASNAYISISQAVTA